MAYERECLLCKKHYRYCPYCSDFEHEPRWKIMFHDENCNRIFDTLQKHSTKKYTDAEAVKILKSCDLSVLKNSTETIRKQVQAILATEKPKSRSKKVNKIN